MLCCGIPACGFGLRKPCVFHIMNTAYKNRIIFTGFQYEDFTNCVFGREVETVRKGERFLRSIRFVCYIPLWYCKHLKCLQLQAFCFHQAQKCTLKTYSERPMVHEGERSPILSIGFIRSALPSLPVRAIQRSMKCMTVVSTPIISSIYEVLGFAARVFAV